MSSSSEQDDLEVQEDSSDEEVLSNDAGIADEDTESNGESEAGELEAENSDDNELTNRALAIDASSTESDEDDDDEVDDDEDIPKPAKADLATIRKNKIDSDIMERYNKRKGLQLYIRFPEKLPEDPTEFDTKVKSLSELIVTAHKPRQKYARFCLVDFANMEHRDKTLKLLNKSSSETKILASIPRTESDDFVKTLAEKKLKQIEKKRAKQLLKRETRKAIKQKQFTSTIVVLNVPKSASIAQVKEVFPDSVDIQMRPAPSKFTGVSIATITLPSTADARKNVKREVSLGGTKLIIRFNNLNKKIKKSKKKKAPKNEDVTPSENIKLAGKKNKQKKDTTNGTKAAEKQIPLKKSKPTLSKKRESNDDGDDEVPQKITKLPLTVKVVGKAVQKKLNKAGDGKPFVNVKTNNKVAQKKGKAPLNKKGGDKKGSGKKQSNQNKPQKKR